VASAGAGALVVTTNGPVVWGVAVCDRVGMRFCRIWRTFCRPGTIFIEHYACRGTSLIGAVNLSPVTYLVAGTGAVSRYKLSRSQKFVMVQDLNYGQMSVSGCNGHYEFVLSAGVKAKSVTNNLPLLSVLAAVMVCF